MVTLMEILLLAVCADASVATAVIVCGPSRMLFEFQETVYNGPAPVTGLAMATPSAWKTTFAIPALEEAVAATVMVPLIVAEFDGALSVTNGVL